MAWGRRSRRRGGLGRGRAMSHSASAAGRSPSGHALQRVHRDRPEASRDRGNESIRHSGSGFPEPLWAEVSWFPRAKPMLCDQAADQRCQPSTLRLNVGAGRHVADRTAQSIIFAVFRHEFPPLYVVPNLRDVGLSSSRRAYGDSPHATERNAGPIPIGSELEFLIGPKGCSVWPTSAACHRTGAG